VLLGVLWAVALWGAAIIAGEAFVVDTVEAFVRRLRETAWAWPLAVAVAITVLTSPPAAAGLSQPAASGSGWSWLPGCAG
jgi:hypothetical protein